MVVMVMVVVVVANLLHRGNVFGFDAEWRIAWRGPQRPTALVQICDAQTVALLHLVHMEGKREGWREQGVTTTTISANANVLLS